MLLAFSIPPKRVLDWRCASFSYGNGPTRSWKSATMGPAYWNAPGSQLAFSGSTYTDCGTHCVRSLLRQAVSPRSWRTSGPAAITISEGGIGLPSRHLVSVRPAPSDFVPSGTPFPTTVRPVGARTVHDTVALSLG